MVKGGPKKPTGEDASKMKLKLANTKLKDDYGRFVDFYHTTDAKQTIQRFHPLTHFGTQKAAQMRGFHLVYKALGMIEPLKGVSALPKTLQKRLDVEHPNLLKTYRVHLSMKNPCEICDFGRHNLAMYHQRFSSFYLPKSIYLTPKECRERDALGPEKMPYKKALSEFIFVHPFQQSTEALKKELEAEHLFSADSNDPKELAENVGYQRMIRYLESEGYDGFVYVNDCEDEGEKSYIIFRSEQVFQKGETEHELPPILKENLMFLNQIENEFFESKGMIAPYQRKELNRQIRAKRLIKTK